MTHLIPLCLKDIQYVYQLSIIMKLGLSIQKDLQYIQMSNS